MKKDVVLNIIGVIFLILGIISFSRIFILGAVWQNVFWWCDHAGIIVGLAILFRNSFWLTAELNIAIIPQILWSMDFLSKTFFDKFIFGFTAYMFEGHWALKFLSYQHLFMFILAIVALFMMGKANKKAWIGSIIHGVIIFITGLLIPASYNINCAHRSCLGFEAHPYPLVWWALFLAIVFVTNFILVKCTKLFSSDRHIKK